jgi:hypothetical protein
MDDSRTILKHLKNCVVEFAVFTYEGEIFPGGLPVN